MNETQRVFTLADRLGDRLYPPIQGIIETAKEKTSVALCSIGYDTVFLWFIIPILLIVFMFVLIRYKTIISDWIMYNLAKKGFIWVEIIQPNKHLKTKRIKLDKYRRFKIGEKSYVLDNLDDFIIGYKKSMPYFLYDDKFVLPLKMNEKELSKRIADKIGVKNFENLKKKDKNKIRALELIIDTHILNKVLGKKLISDLYSISSGELEFKRLLLWVGLGIIGFIFAYYMGWIDLIISYLQPKGG